LPTIERRIELPRAVSAAEQRALSARIDAVAQSTLLQSGCAAAWDFADGRTIRVTFTPLSDQDARGVDAPSSAFAREVGALLPASEPSAAAKAPAAPPAEAPPSRRKAARAKEAAPAPAAEEAPEPAARPAPRKAKRAAEPATPAPKRKRAAAAKTPATPRSSAKRTTVKTTKTPAKKG
jgi:hypothetical protein